MIILCKENVVKCSQTIPVYEVCHDQLKQFAMVYIVHGYDHGYKNRSLEVVNDTLQNKFIFVS